MMLVEHGELHTTLTYAELAAASARMANYWRACGVRVGDRVLVLLPNNVDMFVVTVAAIKIGASLVPCTTVRLKRAFAFAPTTELTVAVAPCMRESHARSCSRRPTSRTAHGEAGHAMRWPRRRRWRSCSVRWRRRRRTGRCRQCSASCRAPARCPTGGARFRRRLPSIAPRTRATGPPRLTASCSCTSPQAPRRRPRWSSTRTARIPSAISRTVDGRHGARAHTRAARSSRSPTPAEAVGSHQDHVLAWAARNRRALEHQLSRLGQARVEVTPP